jgi:drug/metabolite transporter (DMT)-like permease
MGLGETLSIASALAWAGGVILYKRLGENLPPQHLNLLKNLLVLAMVLPTVLLVEGLQLPSIPLPALLLGLLSGALGIAVADTLYLTALNRIGAARMGIIGNFYSPFVIALSFVFLGERLGPIQFIGFVLVTLGVLIVNVGAAGSGSIDNKKLRQGAIYGAIAILLMAVAIVMIKRVLENQPLLWIVLLRLVGGVAGMLAMFALNRERLFSADIRVRWGILFVAAFLGQYLSMILWLAGYKYTDASIASILNESSSVFIILLAWLFLGEGLGARKIAGVVCTMAGLACMLLA